MSVKKKSKLQRNKEDVNSGYWMRKCYRLWSTIVRDFENRKCAVCNSTDYINAHHLLPKEHYFNYSLNPLVGISICVKCHKYSAFAFHKNSLWCSDWLKRNRPEQYKWCMKRINNVSKRPKLKKDQPDYKEIYENLCNFKMKDMNWND